MVVFPKRRVIDGRPPEYFYIEMGLDDLIPILKDNKIESFVIPPLGAGSARLEWDPGSIYKVEEKRKYALKPKIYL